MVKTPLAFIGTTISLNFDPLVNMLLSSLSQPEHPTHPLFHHVIPTCVVFEEGEDRRTSSVDRFPNDCMRPADDGIPEWLASFSEVV